MSKLLRCPKPVGYRILIKLKNPSKEEMSKGGVIISAKYGDEYARNKYASEEAYVIDVSELAFYGKGDGRPWCKVGDLIRFSRYAGQDMLDIEEGQIYRIINDDDVHCVMTGEEYDSSK